MKRPALGVIDPNISSSQDGQFALHLLELSFLNLPSHFPNLLEPAAKKQRTSIRSADYEKVENFVKILKSFGIEMDAGFVHQSISSLIPSSLLSLFLTCSSR